MSGAQAAITGHAGERHGGRIVRYTLTERINHWIGGFAYIYLLITGLAFWLPYLFWLAALAGGGPAARYWHPWVGLAFFASMIWMLVDWRADMATAPEDLKWKDNIQYYIRNEDEKLPPAGRFNWGQKLFFWVMVYGVVFLLLSGLAMWWVNDISWPYRWVRYLAVLIHDTAALVTIGAFIIHVYMGTAFVRGSFSAIVDGTVPEAWARTHHRLWYDKVTRK
jgi:formate dehydrogenase subunit gamma